MPAKAAVNRPAVTALIVDFTVVSPHRPHRRYRVAVSLSALLSLPLAPTTRGSGSREDAVVSEGRRDNVLLVHWHDLGRYLGVYGHPDVSSPCLDALARDGILFTDAYATAPLCSPSRGSLFTGRYPQSNGLIGLAHHGWEYRPGVRTLPRILSESGYHTTLFGMQHETSFPSRLGFDEFDVSNSYCEYVVDRAVQWLSDPPDAPFLLTTGFFETHRPYPHDRYDPADPDAVTVPE